MASWKRLVRFIAVEDELEHIGEPVDPELDGELWMRFCKLRES